HLLKRYGDGFVEQQLINDQLLALTGRRLNNSGNSGPDSQAAYRALLDAGVAFGQRFQLTPGVALSAEHMAQLTADIVWLTTQTVTLPNGQQEHVLVPQLYVHRPADADLTASGALLAGTQVTLVSPGDIVNSGTIKGDIAKISAE